MSEGRSLGALTALFSDGNVAVTALPVLEERYEHDLADLIARIEAAAQDFPELEGEQVTLVPDRPDEDRKGGAWPIGRVVFVPCGQYVDNVTIYHELGHLAIRALVEDGADLPTTSEEFCAIFAMARMPPERIDDDRVPYLDQPTVPRELYPEICERALAYREEHRDYIAQCNRWLTGADAL
jgi:hypothetical protein